VGVRPRRATFATPEGTGHRSACPATDRGEHARVRNEVPNRDADRGRIAGPAGPGRPGAPPVAALGRSGALVAILLVLAVVPFFLRRRERPPEEPPPPPALRLWDLPGCYAVELDPWTPPGDSAVTGPPRSFMLVADSLDEWGRQQETFRVEALPDTLAGSSPYRWLVRADTLWLVWNRGVARGGLALRERDDGFVGRARVTGGGVDVTARAEALRINCATGRPEPPRSGRR